jgi:hypothetical protein
VAQKSRSEKSLRSGVGLVGQDRCDAKRGAAYGFCFRHRWISTPVAGASCSHHHGRNDRARGSAIDAARSRENWSLSIRTFAPASELHSPRGGSFVEGRQFPIFERPNSSYDRGTVPVPGAASSLYEGRLDGPLAGRVGVLGQMFLFFELNQPRYDENSFCNFSARLRDASRGSRCFKQPRPQRQPCAGQGFSFWKYSAAANGQ